MGKVTFECDCLSCSQVVRGLKNWDYVRCIYVVPSVKEVFRFQRNAQITHTDQIDNSKFLGWVQSSRRAGYHSNLRTT